MADLAAITVTAKDETGPGLNSVERNLKKLQSQAATLFGGVIGTTALVVLAKSAFDAADQVNRLRQQTGLTASEIDRLTVVAGLNDMQASALVKSYKALATAMNEARDPASKQAKMFEALGVAVYDSSGNMRSLADMTRDIAPVFAAAKDGPEKLAVAVGVFGKSGADMIPVLNQMSEDMQKAALVQQAFGEITDETARSGDAFNDSMTLLGEGLKRAFLPAVDSMGPAMERFTTAMIATGQSGSALAPVMRVIFDDILPAAIETVGALIISANALAKALGNLLGGLAASLVQLASGNFGAAWETAKEAWRDSDKIIADSNVQIAALMNRSKEATPAIAATADATNKMAKAAGALAEGAGKAGNAMKFWLQGMGDIADALKREDDARKKALEAQVKENDELNKALQAGAKITEDIDKRTEAYEKEIDALTMSKDAIYARDIAQLKALRTQIIAVDGVTDEVAALEREIAALERLRGVSQSIDSAAAAKQAAEDWASAARSIGDDLTSAFLNAAESGKDFFKSLANDLYRMFSGLVLRPIIQGVMAPMAGGITSALYGGSGVGAGGGGMGLLGSLFGGIGNASAAGPIVPTFGSSLIGGMSSPLNTISTLWNDGSAAFGGMSGALGAGLGAALPFIGVASMLASMFSSKGGPKTGGFASTGGVGTDNWGPSSADSTLAGVVAQWQTAFDTALSSMGGSGSANFLAGYDMDPNGSANNRLETSAYVNGQRAYHYFSGDDSLGRDDATLQARMELEGKRAVLAALQASDLPQQIAAVFNTMTAGSASSEAIDNLLAFGGAMKSVMDAIGGSVVEDAQAAWEASQRSSVEMLRAMGAGVIDLATNMDGTTASMQSLAAATGDYRNAVVQTLLGIESVRGALADMFGATRETIEFAGLSNQDAYDLNAAKAEALTGLLTTTDDPALVQKYADQINGYMLAAFNLLNPTEQLAEKADFMTNLAAVEEATNARLNAIKGLIGDETAGPFAAAQAALDGAAGKFQAAAADQVSAAGTMMQAANKMVAAAEKIDGATFTVNVAPALSPVGGG